MISLALAQRNQMQYNISYNESKKIQEYKIKECNKIKNLKKFMNINLFLYFKKKREAVYID